MTFENGGVFSRHCPQTLACLDSKGNAHILHDGPEYFSSRAQQEVQIGACAQRSEESPQEGHFDGYRMLSSLEIRTLRWLKAPCICRIWVPNKFFPPGLCSSHRNFGRR